MCFANGEYRTHSFPLVNSVNSIQHTTCNLSFSLFIPLFTIQVCSTALSFTTIFCRKLVATKMTKLERRPCHFNEKLQKKYPFLRKQKNKTDSYVFCEICFSNLSIKNGGQNDITRHIETAKHQQASKESADAQSSSDEHKSIPRISRKRKKVRG